MPILHLEGEACCVRPLLTTEFECHNASDGREADKARIDVSDTNNTTNVIEEQQSPATLPEMSDVTSMSDFLAAAPAPTQVAEPEAQPAQNSAPPDEQSSAPSAAAPVIGLRGGRSLLGIDIGRRTLKLVHLQQSGSGIRVHDAAVIDLPLPADPERADAVRDAVRRFTGNATLRIRNACCVLSGEGVGTVCCTMPKMPDSELAEATRWKTSEVSSVDVETAIHGHYVLDMDRPGSKLDVVTAAVPDHVQNVDALFPNDNPRLSVVVTGPIAAEDMLLTALRAREHGALALIDIGLTTSTLSVVGANGLEFTRELPVGGDNVTAALTGKLSLESGAVNISRAAAEEIKRNYQIGQTGDIVAGGVTVPATRVLSAIRPVIERLGSEIVRSLQFYAQGHGLAKVETLHLSGGGSLLGGLSEYLTRETRVPTVKLDPWDLLGADVSSDINVDRSLLALATGAAIHDASRINLLPPHVRAKRTISTVRTGSVVLSAFALLALMGLAFTAGRQNAKLLGVIETKQGSTAPLESVAALVGEAEQYKAELERRKAIQRSLGVGKPMHAAILGELSNIMPEGTYLKSLSFSVDKGVRKSRLDIDIYAMPNASAVRLKQGLIAALEESPFFVNVSFAPSRDRGPQPSRAPDEALTLTCQVLGFPGD
jgi:type IV pilus assembly protein PilM